jgi:hypothetical protein
MMNTRETDLLQFLKNLLVNNISPIFDRLRWLIWDLTKNMRAWQHENAAHTFASVNMILAGPYPFQRIRLMSRFLSSPVSSSIVVDTIDALLDLKLVA